ncbi:hypothetical protein, partial [Prosthecodimorpha hirschii]|uniref:hypothetical protein n=1 Tax=Prosthecodimorpha hirschii TaxID=665126 RepID=UPI001AEDE476
MGTIRLDQTTRSWRVLADRKGGYGNGDEKRAAGRPAALRPSAPRRSFCRQGQGGQLRFGLAALGCRQGDDGRRRTVVARRVPAAPMTALGIAARSMSVGGVAARGMRV